jgi:3-oxoadipate enol-lactonase
MLLDTGTSRIAFETKGDRKNKAIVFIHGFPFDRKMWTGQAELLSADHFVATFDMRGHGESDGGSAQYLIEFFVDDLISLMDYLGLRTVSLCGLSMGGYTALRAFERDPSRFAGLILCDTKSAPDTNAAKLNRANQIRTILAGKKKEFADAQVKALFASASLERKKEEVAMIRRVIESTGDTALVGALIALAARMDMTESLQKIAVPTLIIVGEEDKVTPVSDAEFMHSRIPNSKLAIVHGAGHLSNLENPPEFNAALRSFLGENDL